jgi:2-polyprenyl-3-methyl-5-hydroxy-6-metoxy-1,4-benzoquinol methylase
MQAFPTAEFVERTSCINCSSDQLTELSRGCFSEQPLLGFIESDPWGESPLPYLDNAEWILVRCAGCNQVFHRKVLNDTWNEKRFSTWMSAEAMREFELRLGRESPLPQRQFAKAREHIEHILRIEKLTKSIRKPNEALRLLDFGCGWGEFLAACEHFGFSAYGVDRSTPRIAAATIRIFQSLDELENEAAFHAVTLFEVLEHLDEPAAVLSRLSQLLAPGGVLVLETPDCKDITSIQSHRDYRKVHPLEHINAFTTETLTSIATRQGFSPIRRGTAHVTSSLFQVARKEIKHWLGRDGRSTQLYFRKM